MTTTEWINKQEQLWEKVASSQALGNAAFDTHRVMANRIFNKGLDSSGARIGNYNSTKPIYVNPKNSPRKFATQGKTGKRRKDNGQPYKTRFFPSYKAFREAIGREAGKVILNLFGRLQSDFVTGLRRKNNVEYESVLKESINQKKKSGLEKKYGKKIFSLTSQERIHFKETLEKEVSRILHAQ